MPSRARSAASKAAVAGASSSASASTKTRQSSRVTKPTAKTTAAKTSTANAKPTKAAAPSKKRKAATASKTETDEDERQAKKARTAAPSKNKTVSDKTKAVSDKTKAAASSRKSKPASEAKSKAEKPKTAAPSKKSTAASKAKPGSDKAKTAYAVKDKAEVAEDIKAIAASEPKKARFEPKVAPIGKKINSAPTQPLEVFVFGEGSAGELGLGSTRIDGKKPIDVKRPRLNEKYLSAKDVGVVQIACGGMHSVALTRDNVILTWGVNDNGALGRDTTWSGGLRDVDASDDSDSDSEDSGLNPLESTPSAVSAVHFAPGTKFAQVVACDSATFVLTEDGQVYGWGTFRSDDGIFGFTNKIRTQMTPILISGLKNIKSLAAGANHVLALDDKGTVLAWGSGQQNQLGRRIIERNKMSSLLPQSVGLPRGKVVKIACGGYHSFALDSDGHVWGWGLNNFGEIWAESDVGEDNAIILKPVKLTTLYDWKIADIDGGVHHSVACSHAGDLLTWGRIDGYQVGFEIDSIAKDDIIFDERELPRILSNPCKHQDVPAIASVAAGTDNSFAVSRDGKVYAWGFSANYQTGLGTMDDVHTPTLVDNSAIRDKKVVAAYAGGQFSVVVCVADEATADGASKAVVSEATATTDAASSAVAPPVKATADGPSEAAATPAEAVATPAKATADDASEAVATSPKATAGDASTAVATPPKATAEGAEANTKAVEADDTVAGEAVAKADEAAAPQPNGLNGH
ncbi:hypothetical protein L249_2538 [Ophiocordyceps polyrhachis-furcata BCC 54312]|uniref:RCC1-like domain-containing protein n=1 Tax=Ophiocordyceps polyrhachis-furcata BCC 54312 TaxID=1330021 RepID=A0A367LR18_9HYPO|nr:hypothetical protein L249_2538 [Ophiocordyceps polyrhachis-furcata BCC 54312]